MPWSPAQALAFLAAAQADPPYPAFALLLVYGMRRGEVLGLRWQDIETATEVIGARQPSTASRASWSSGRSRSARAPATRRRF